MVLVVGEGWPVMTNRLRPDPDDAVATIWWGPLSSGRTEIVTEKRPETVAVTRVGERNRFTEAISLRQTRNRSPAR